MLQVSYIRENQEQFLEGIKKRKMDAEALLKQILNLDETRRSKQKQLDDTLAERNRISKEIGILFGQKKIEEANQLKAKTADFKSSIEQFQSEMNEASNQLKKVLLSIPNIPHPSVPEGHTEEDNEVFQDWPQALPEMGAEAKPHWELAKKYELFDLETGAKIAGAGFPLYKGKGARLQRALINFFLDEAINAGYLEINPPLLINEDTAYGTGQLPDKEGQMYHCTEDKLYLLPTAEVPVTNIYRDTIVKDTDFPIKLTAYSPCFRREAGSYGAHVRGLNRVHQFEKVEIIQVQHPDKSYDTLQEMVLHIEGVLKKLELPYRILRLCSGDLGFTSALTFDFEVYSAAQKRWLEVSSVSNFETFQTNRLKLRYRAKGEKNTHLAHTLNGSALALARIYAALLENNQTAEGILIPKALQSYTGFDAIG